jgi:hypothetical protein
LLNNNDVDVHEVYDTLNDMVEEIKTDDPSYIFIKTIIIKKNKKVLNV